MSRSLLIVALTLSALPYMGAAEPPQPPLKPGPAANPQPGQPPQQPAALANRPAIPPTTDEELKERVANAFKLLKRTLGPDEVDQVRRNIAAMGGRSVPMFMKAVQEDPYLPPHVHWNLCLAFGRMADESVLPYLIHRAEPVSDKELKVYQEWNYVRCFAILSLGKTPDQGKLSFGPLRAYMADEKEPTLIRRAAILALGSQRDENSLDVFNRILRDPKGGSAEGKHASEMRSAAALALGMLPSEGAAGKLLDYLSMDEKDRDPNTDRTAVMALGLLRREKVGEGLRKLLESKDENLRGVTCLVLAWLNERGSAEDVLKVANDETAPAFTRANAAVALNVLGKPKEGLEYLTKVLSDTPNKYAPGTLMYCAITLGEFPGDDVLKLLHQTVTTHENKIVVNNAINAMGHRKDPRMVPFLCERFFRLQGEVNQVLRAEIARALLNHPPQELIRNTMIKGLKDPSGYVRRKCVITLARYPGSDTDGALIELLDDKDFEVRGEAAVTLGVLKTPRAVEPLRKLLLDPSDWVRLRARVALENIIRFGQNEFQQVSGLQDLLDERLRYIGGSMKEEMDRLYTESYGRVLDLNDLYRFNGKIE